MEFRNKNCFMYTIVQKYVSYIAIALIHVLSHADA